MRFFLVRLFRLFLGLSQPTKTVVESVNLALFDRLMLLKHLASRFFFWQFRKRLPPEHQSAHTLCVGRSGSGKSEALKLLALADKTRHTWRGRWNLRRNHSLVLIDPHGYLAKQLARQQPYVDDYRQYQNNPDLIYRNWSP